MIKTWSNRDLVCGWVSCWCHHHAVILSSCLHFCLNSFFKKGYCSRAEDCEFSHDPSAVPIPDNACLFHLRNICRFDGNNCRFDHLTAQDICSGFVSKTEASTGDEAGPSTSKPGTSSLPATSKPFGIKMVPFKNEDVCLPVSKSNTDASSGSKSYAAVATDPNAVVVYHEEYRMNEPLCPFSVANFSCPQVNCHYLHGSLCDLCNRSCLHPFDEKQRQQHRDECMKEHERQMELSFAIQRSMDKSCGICMDTVMEKEPPSERRFGVLEKCTHIFCLSCIRKWRSTKQFDNRTIRSCPECRVSSDFVVPSEFWVEEKDEKEKLINDYKKAMSNKPCKYFKQGRGECPFAGACFYLHAYPDGTRATMPPPRARRVRTNADGERETLMDVLLWNYLEQRNDPNWLLSLDFDDLLDMRDLGLLSTDDESDFSDYDAWARNILICWFPSTTLIAKKKKK